MPSRPVYISRDPKFCTGCGSTYVLYRDAKRNVGWCKECRELARNSIRKSSLAGLSRLSAEWDNSCLRYVQLRDSSGWSGHNKPFFALTTVSVLPSGASELRCKPYDESFVTRSSAGMAATTGMGKPLPPLPAAKESRARVFASG
jgi:hypothetical protein